MDWQAEIPEDIILIGNLKIFQSEMEPIVELWYSAVTCGCVTS